MFTNHSATDIYDKKVANGSQERKEKVLLEKS